MSGRFRCKGYNCMVDQAIDNDFSMSQGTFDYASYNKLPTPNLLYKYFMYHPPDKSEWTQHIFQKNEIYFSAPKDFNDPFTNLLNIENMCRAEYFNRITSLSQPGSTHKNHI